MNIANIRAHSAPGHGNSRQINRTPPARWLKNKQKKPCGKSGPKEHPFAAVTATLGLAC